MKHNFARVKEVKVLRDYTLRIRFSDESENDINLEPVLQGELYGPLRDKALFNQVSVDSEVGTISWPNGADYDPSMLYAWDEISAEFIAQMNRISIETDDKSVQNNADSAALHPRV